MTEAEKFAQWKTATHPNASRLMTQAMWAAWRAATDKPKPEPEPKPKAKAKPSKKADEDTKPLD